MRLLRSKSTPEGLVDAVTERLGAVRGVHKDTLVKAALLAGGAAALTAGSAAISSLRRRVEAES